MKIFNRFFHSKAGLVALFIGLLLVIGIVWSSLNFTGKNRLIQRVKIRIAPDTGILFVTQQEVSDMLSKIQGNPIGKPLQEINVPRIEKTLAKSPYIENVQVYTSMDGTLSINVRQRLPILRVLNTSNQTFYLDSNGYKIPEKAFYSPDVLVANGYIPEKLEDSAKIHSYALEHLLNVAKYTHNHALWNAQFEQCYVDNFSDILLIPRVGKHSIVIGSSERLPEKLENLRVFYEKGLPNTGWDVYNQINIKYNGMIVGVRSDKQTEHKKDQHVQKQTH